MSARPDLPSPNVIVFFTDQQRWDTTGIHGNPAGLTPNFDRFAARGTHLAHTFTCQPVCGPARSCLQTGLYATETGVFRNAITLDPALPTLPDHFHGAGYTTGYIGKWHLGPRERIGPVAPEHRARYDYWLASNVLEYTSDAYRTTLYDGDEQPVELPGYRVDALADAAIRYLDGRDGGPRDRPFFLFLSFIEPHHQNHRDDYPAPDGYEERYAGAWVPPDLAALGGSTQQHLPGYYGMVKRLDEAFGRVLDALRSLGMADDTVVLYTSDHGNHFKTRNVEYKRSCHESAIRVPTALGGPGFEGGGRVEELTSLIDLPPTLLDAAGIEVPAAMQGRSVLPLAGAGPVDPAWPDQVFVQISESQVGRALRTKRWKYSVSAPELDGGQVPAADRYVEEFLYDLRADRYELCNLAGNPRHAEVASLLRQRLLGCIRDVEGKEPAIELAIEPAGEHRRSGQINPEPADLEDLRPPG